MTGPHERAARAERVDELIPGQIICGEGEIALNEGRPVTVLLVCNAADRPVQVGSHYHFAEANPGLEFDRQAAHGQRLHIPAGTAVRFEPGIPVEVALVPIGGLRAVYGLRGAVAGRLDAVAGQCDGAAGRVDG